MAMNGFVLGGAAEGANTAAEMALKEQQQKQSLSLGSRALDIQQQGQQNAVQQQAITRADAQISQTMSVVGETAQALIDKGTPPEVIAQKVQPLLDSAKSLAAKVGRNPDALDAQVQTLLARPATPQKLQVIGEGLTGKTYGYPNPAQQTATPVNVDTPTGTPAPPGQNITSGQVTGVSVEDAPLPKPDNGAASYVPSKNPQVNKLIDSGVIDAATLDMRAKQDMLGDKTAAVGYGNSKLGVAIRNAIKTRSAELAIQEGLTAEELNARKAETSAATSSLTKLTQLKHSIEAFETTAVKNGDILVDLAQKVDKTGMPMFEKWVRAGRQATGDPDVAQFNTQMTLYRAEVAKILTNPNMGGVLTDDARREVAGALQDGASFAQIKAVHNLLKGDFSRRSAAIDEQIGKINKSFGLTPKQPSAAPTASSSAPSTAAIPNIPPPPPGSIRIR